jgi:carboxyl-terminal processing protease
MIDKVKLSAISVARSNIVKESNLSGHLENQDEADGDDAAKVEDDTRQEREELATSDFELYEALNLLKGMVLLHSRSASN